jgi:hypothetical protein
MAVDVPPSYQKQSLEKPSLGRLHVDMIVFQASFCFFKLDASQFSLTTAR